jgi:rifampicin phosphotransferase
VSANGDNQVLENSPAHVKFTLALRDLRRAHMALVGAKAATLGELSNAGFAVPDGFVVTTAAFERFVADNNLLADHSSAKLEAAIQPDAVADAIRSAAGAYLVDAAPVAVRSSSVAEDLDTASYAGQYETVLGVTSITTLMDAVRRCWISAFSPRVDRYRAARSGWAEEWHEGPGHSRASPAPDAMAVLVQRQVIPDAAGVAVTANPITGNRRETLVSAVRGLGDRLVSGQAVADEWVVHDDAEGGVRKAVCRVAPEHSITEAQALAVAALSRRVEAHLGVPQDVEWALRDGELFLLQARPITGLPVLPATATREAWRAPYPGGWARNFRFGEWLGDPVTPLFETWLLPAMERSFWVGLRRVADMPAPRPTYVVVNGWYFTSMNFWPPNALGWLIRLARHPRLMRVLLQFNPALANWALGPWVREWRISGLPKYVRVVRHAEQHVDSLSAGGLVQLVDGVAEAAGEYFVWIALVAGAAYKTEAPLARFYRRHLFRVVGGSHQQLLYGVADPALPIAPHAVHSLDWWQPTFGEVGADQRPAGGGPDVSDRRAQAAEARDQAVAQARGALAHQARRRKQFEQLLATARRYARLREEIVAHFTLGWPALRRAALRLGDELVEAGVLDNPHDIFYLSHGEVTAMQRPGPPTGLRAQVAERRQTWESQRKLVAPLVLGHIPHALLQGLNELEAALAPGAATSSAALRGLPASPGQTTGHVRIIRSPAEFDRLEAGDVLVAPATTPAWTPLFARAAAVITDTGGVLAHTSIVAREYGIPAVVGTVDATVRLRDGQTVRVDGTTGVIELWSVCAG